MSRIRVSNAPDGWRYEGYSRPFVVHGYGGTLAVPHEPVRLTPAELALKQAAKAVAAALVAPPKPTRWFRRRLKRVHLDGCRRSPHHKGMCTLPPATCGQYMKIAKEPCARNFAHKGACSTRRGLDLRAANKRRWEAENPRVRKARAKAA
jgi:hypothetical protein